MKLAALSGSTREGSVNVKLARLVAHTAGVLGHSGHYIDLAEFPMPLYDANVEAASGPPVAVRSLHGRLEGYDALFFAAPEYNASVTPLLKNTVDWLSRPKVSDMPPLALFKARPVMLGAATPGAMGGLRGLIAARQIFALGLGALVIAEQIAVPNALQTFNERGGLSDEKLDKLLVDGVRRLGEICDRLNASNSAAA